MEENKELTDIILNKKNSKNGNKKIILAVATLGVILIVVVMLMNTLSSDDKKNLPQAVLPPQPKSQQPKITEDEPLFEDVEVIQEENKADKNLDNIAQKLKEESLKEEQTTKDKETIVEKPKKIESKKVPKIETKQKVKTEVKKKPKKKTLEKAYYIQVGSFSRYAPNKKFLKSITDRGYTYRYYKTKVHNKILNKVLVGPFYNETDAKKARIKIRSKIEAGAFLIKI